MALLQIELSPGHIATVAMDDEMPISKRLWAIAYARLIDNASGKWVGAPVTILVAESGVTGRTVSDGLIMLIARPHDLFPNLTVQSYTVQFSIYAAGYQPVPNFVALIPALPAFPTTFNPVNLGDIHLQPI
jgi:hypothetical protein